MATRVDTPDHRLTATAAGRSIRAGGRLTSTVVAATTLAAVLAGLMQAGAGQAFGRSARGDAVAAVALAMAREMMAARQVEPPTAAPIGATETRPQRPRVVIRLEASRGEGERLGPHRLDLPPPAA